MITSSYLKPTCWFLSIFRAWSPRVNKTLQRTHLTKTKTRFLKRERTTMQSFSSVCTQCPERCEAGSLISSVKLYHLWLPAFKRAARGHRQRRWWVWRTEKELTVRQDDGAARKSISAPLLMMAELPSSPAASIHPSSQGRMLRGLIEDKKK